MEFWHHLPHPPLILKGQLGQLANQGGCWNHLSDTPLCQLAELMTLNGRGQKSRHSLAGFNQQETRVSIRQRNPNLPTNTKLMESVSRTFQDPPNGTEPKLTSFATP